MTLAFTYESRPGRVVFGSGRLACLRDEVDRLGAGRVLLLSTPRRGEAGARLRAGERAAALLGARLAGVFDRAAMHVPAEVADAARGEADRVGADCVVTVGGGSVIGLGKAIALSSGRPLVAVPTTYSGSEMTPIWGITAGGVKTTGRDPGVQPKAVIYDPALTTGLPASVSAVSGMNAIAHCVEALYAIDANPVTSLMAEEGIRALADALPAVVREPSGLDARSRALYGAWLGGASLGAVQMALHHKLCHVLGGSFGLPHAETHAVILPHAAAYNVPAAPDAMRRVARALGAEDAPAALHELAASLGAPTSLRELGMRADELDRAADLAVRTPYPNPRPVTREGVRRLLDDAYHGRRPEAAS